MLCSFHAQHAAYRRRVDADEAADLAESSRCEMLRQRFDTALAKHGEFGPWQSLGHLAWDAIGDISETDAIAFLQAAMHALRKCGDKDSERALHIIFQHVCETTK